MPQLFTIITCCLYVAASARAVKRAQPNVKRNTGQ